MSLICPSCTVHVFHVAKLFKIFIEAVRIENAMQRIIESLQFYIIIIFSCSIQISGYTTSKSHLWTIVHENNKLLLLIPRRKTLTQVKRLGWCGLFYQKCCMSKNYLLKVFNPILFVWDLNEHSILVFKVFNPLLYFWDVSLLSILFLRFSTHSSISGISHCILYCV